jgi:hypothetical protein
LINYDLINALIDTILIIILRTTEYDNIISAAIKKIKHFSNANLSKIANIVRNISSERILFLLNCYLQYYWRNMNGLLKVFKKKKKRWNRVNATKPTKNNVILLKCDIVYVNYLWRMCTHMLCHSKQNIVEKSCIIQNICSIYYFSASP